MHWTFGIWKKGAVFSYFDNFYSFNLADNTVIYFSFVIIYGNLLEYIAVTYSSYSHFVQWKLCIIPFQFNNQHSDLLFNVRRMYSFLKVENPCRCSRENYNFKENFILMYLVFLYVGNGNNCKTGRIFENNNYWNKLFKISNIYIQYKTPVSLIFIIDSVSTDKQNKKKIHGNT